jgi:hypothetical protein
MRSQLQPQFLKQTIKKVTSEGRIEKKTEKDLDKTKGILFHLSR